MWNHDRRSYHLYMKKMNELYPNSVTTKMESIAYKNKLIEKKQVSDNKYNKVPNMKDAMLKVRNNNRTHNLDMVNATTSKTKY